ncbi:hypothetical protein GCM10008995_17030 [Halobellus salinus]|uniref:Uncharacterized protein n=1 Tax=Halobellus salinus TaxID=931585 RepID=A0A830EQQ4_9EURY|nr:hypothetical protein GCM10008995_17030 [Halobellus salinus]SMP26476.1 hypothetical protein SAMN06265347_11193 [Halobellus salinus]
MHTEADPWVCRLCEYEEPRDSQADAAMATQDGQRDDGAPADAPSDPRPPLATRRRSA